MKHSYWYKLRLDTSITGHCSNKKHGSVKKSDISKELKWNKTNQYKNKRKTKSDLNRFNKTSIFKSFSQQQWTINKSRVDFEIQRIVR